MSAASIRDMPQHSDQRPARNEADEKPEQLIARLNWLRAGVMGANDGIVSTAGMVVGMAGASASHQFLLVSGAAALVAGALSMAAGEYVSVCSQRDSERAELEHERRQLAADPDYGLRQLTGLIQAHGIEQPLARQVAVQLTRTDALSAHARLELNIDPRALANPWTAALASTIAFVTGGAIPVAAVVLAPRADAVPATAAAVMFALAITGALSAHLGRAPRFRAALRTVSGGVLAMAATYAIGALVAAYS